MACAQNEISRGVSRTSTPPHDLNHWRFESTIVTVEIGTLNTRRAILVSRSNLSSGGVSRIFSAYKTSSRAFSSGGMGGVCMEGSKPCSYPKHIARHVEQ